MKEAGKVYLVGAGPGDPGLITWKGLELIRQADVLVYDRLVAPELLAYAPEGAEVIYAGKAAAEHALSQEEINALLVAKAKEGKTVVRLKGGDPFVFGRGGEEAEALVEAGILFEVVPGVSAAYAVPAYAGIPVTHRRLASSLVIVTGHEDPTKSDPTIAWDKLATGGDTLVFLMGVERLPQITEALLAHGRSPQTPVAIIQWGTRPRQRTVTATLADIVAKAQEAELGPPAVLVVGEVVNLRQTLRWFDKLPLFGQRVLVTRTRRQASALSQLLIQVGAEPVELPTIEVEEPVDYGALDEAVINLSGYDWIIFTSVHGVEAVLERLFAHHLDVRQFSDVYLCAIGPATASALEKYGLRADWVPPEYSGQAILQGFAERGVKGEHILLPRADIAPEDLPQGLEKLGAEVDTIEAYRTIRPQEAEGSPWRVGPAWEQLRTGQIDVVTFTSSSTVSNLIEMLGAEKALLNDTVVACIGPVTAQTVREAGLRVDVVAREHTIPGLVTALREWYQK